MHKYKFISILTYQKVENTKRSLAENKHDENKDTSKSLVSTRQHNTGYRNEHLVAVHAADEKGADKKVANVTKADKVSARVESTVDKEYVDHEIDNNYN